MLLKRDGVTAMDTVCTDFGDGISFPPGNIFTVVICNDLERRWNKHVFGGSRFPSVCFANTPVSLLVLNMRAIMPANWAELNE